jgi:hypothetical protein
MKEEVGKERTEKLLKNRFKPFFIKKINYFFWNISIYVDLYISYMSLN